MIETLLRNAGAVVIYAALGIVIFIGAFVLIDRITPGHLWTELLEHRNMALAILMGSFGIALSIIIAASIHS